jgi:hypothetical protein
MTDFRNNHYVPKWYQERFLPVDGRERKFYYLDLNPAKCTNAGHSYSRAALRMLGPKKCFRERDLYTTSSAGIDSIDIERLFFGRFDSSGPAAVEYFASFAHPSVNYTAFQNMLTYMSLQKLRTPKGLAYFAAATRVTQKNSVLRAIQELRNIFGATWTECVWSIADASNSIVKFIVSDHPVTVYNHKCFPGATVCRGFLDPDVRLTGTHTLFPLDLNKVLILTNLSWARNPYTSPLTMRPNPRLLRNAVFNFTQIHTGRALSELEVCEINYIIKQRAYRYIAAAEKDWLFPERALATQQWDKLGDGYLLLPDPRSITFSSEMILSYSDGHTDAFDEYGRRPGEKDYGSKDDHEWNAHLAFQGEFARVFGKRRRGCSYDWGREVLEDTDDFHAYHLQLEAKYKPTNATTRRGARKRKRK